MLRSSICAFSILLFTAAAGAQPALDVPVRPASSPIAVDGLLSEAAWAEATPIAVAWEWFPGDNAEPPVTTECLVTFDDDRLYVAFRAADPRPEAIRAHLADRDSAFDDDVVGFVVDPFADRRRGFRFQVNPLGVQMDALVDDVDDSTDWSWDAIWDSAGRIGADGYTVEIAVPWKQLRFPRAGGEGGAAGGQTWGFLALRDYPRSLDHQLRSSTQDRDRDCFVCQFHTVSGLDGLTPGLNAELTPTVTGSRADQREDFPDGRVVEGDEEAEAGLTARWGITPNVALSAAVNPDFSQVEADAAALDVNERFALFFPEKRPFFLEGADLFSTPLPAVFTRTVADPDWGLKLTGKEGRHAFGVLVARDDLTNLIFPAHQGSDSASLAAPHTAAIVRYRSDVGRRSNLGLLYTGRDGSGYRNQLAAFDGAVRLSDSDTVRFQLAGSRTAYPGDVAAEFGQPQGSFDDLAGQLLYTHNDRDWSWYGFYRDLGADFRADSGFLPQVDTRRYDVGFDRRLWGEEGDWYSQIELSASVDATRDQAGEIEEWGADVGLAYQGPWQSRVSVFFAPNEEHFDGVDYRNDRYSIGLSARPAGGLAVGTGINWGHQIDVSNSRRAHFFRLTPEVAFNLGRHVEGSFAHLWQQTGVDVGDLFEAHVSELRLLYHFDRRTYLRALVQREHVDFTPESWLVEVADEEETLFLQLLFSYKLNPQTVVLAGYSEERFGDADTSPKLTGRTFFLKLGYAVLF